jgi:hypothetical protein
MEERVQKSINRARNVQTGKYPPVRWADLLFAGLIATPMLDAY